MILLLVSFIAGVLTVLAPCVLPLLPVIVGSSLAGGVNTYRAYIITASLGVSVVVFTLLLKVSTVFINIPQSAWEWISGGILILFGIVGIFPELWERLGFISNLNRGSNRLLAVGYQKQSLWGDVVIGAALGPVFSACSPTYFVILATVLPASFGMGVVNLFAYAFGLSLMLLLVALVGQRLVEHLGLASDTHGWFRRGIGALILLVGILVFTGAEKRIELWLLENVFDITSIEQTLLHIRSR